jgi:hypothetical protein
VSLGIVLDEVGATYTSKGMIFVVVEFTRPKSAIVAKCLVLDDNPKFTVRIPPGTVMDVEDWSSMWAEALRIASPGEQGKVSP